MHDNDEPLLDAEGHQSWEDFLGAFKRDIYPHFQRHGVSLGEAIIVVRLARLENVIQEVSSGHPNEGDE
jgi:hypothetical protein